MKKKTMLAIGAAVVLLSGAATAMAVSHMEGKNLAEPVEDQEQEREEIVFDITDDMEQAYKDEYVKKHLTFLESNEYERISSTGGKFVTEIANALEDSNVNAANKTWDQLSSFLVAVGTGELDEGAKNHLQINNKYDLIVSYLMKSTASEENFAMSSNRILLDSMAEVLMNIKEILSDTEGVADSFSKGGLDKAGDVAETIDGLLFTIQEFQGVEPEQIQSCYQEALDTVKEKINKEFLPEDQSVLKKQLLALKGAEFLTSITSDTYEDCMNALVLYTACEEGTDIWCQTWEKIADAAETEGMKESKLLAKSIQTILGEIKKHKEDNNKALVEKMLKSGGEHTVIQGIQFLHEGWTDSMSVWSVGNAIKNGSIAGVKLANLVTNCDAIAYNCEMLISAGNLADICWEIMIDAEKNLDRKKDFDSAVAFDQIFNIYKETQIVACDYAIYYYTSIASAPVEYIFKYTSDDETGASVVILSEKAYWESYFCHKDDRRVVNNGGRFVGYRGNTYYWRFAPGAVEEQGILGGFSQVEEVQNELICRSANGKETVLLKDNGSGPIYICGNSLFYEKTHGNWEICDLRGAKKGSYTKKNIQDVHSEDGIIVVSDFDGNVFFYDEDGNNTKLDTSEALYIGYRDDILYYGKPGDASVEVYSYLISAKNEKKIGTIALSDEYSFGMTVVEDVQFHKGNLYFSCGYTGGTGMVFSNGGIYCITSMEALETLVDAGGSTRVGMPKFYIQDKKDQSVLYFYSGDGYSMAGFWDAWAEEHICEINLETKVVKNAQFRLSNIGDSLCVDGEVLTLADSSGEYQTVLSREEGEKLGYTAIGDDSGDSQVFVRHLDLVQDVAYFTITKITKAPSGSIGWRTAYTRDAMKTYCTKLGTGEFELINEY